MEAYFFDLIEHLSRNLSPGEDLYGWLSGEQSDFVRFNHGKIRQAGAVAQSTVRLQLVERGRQATAEQSLGRNPDADRSALLGALQRLRSTLDDLPEDPHLLFHEGPAAERLVRESDLPPAHRMAADVVQAADGADLVGLLSCGPIFRGFASSRGHRYWHQTTSFLLDHSVYLRGDQAIKDSLAGFSWEPDRLRASVQRSVQRLSLLARPPRPLSPGRYRAFLAPAALAEIFGLLSWGGFSAKTLRARQSPLVRLQEGERALSPLVSLRENTAGGIAPAFQAEGFTRPPSVSLVEGGAFKGALVSPRSAREYGIPTNGASGAEAPESLDMAGGSLPPSEALKELGTGLWINNLWYLNYSDRGAGRMTGMTRFATFWVEGGELVAPTPVMRFDDSIYDLLGGALEALTTEREFFPDPTTYGERQTGSMRLPGALIGGLTLTL